MLNRSKKRTANGSREKRYAFLLCKTAKGIGISMDKKKIEIFNFESRETSEQTEREAKLIGKLLEKTDVSDPKNALRLYNRAVSEKLFSTMAGILFLMELRDTILESGLVTERALAPIPIKEPEGKRSDVISERQFYQERKLQRLYDGQKLLNKKFKIAIAALVIIILGFIVINFRFEYTIFTYFTDYKANMEEELIDKYQNWEEELKAREEKLDQGSGQTQQRKE